MPARTPSGSGAAEYTVSILDVKANGQEIARINHIQDLSLTLNESIPTTGGNIVPNGFALPSNDSFIVRVTASNLLGSGPISAPVEFGTGDQLFVPIDAPPIISPLQDSQSIATLTSNVALDMAQFVVSWYPVSGADSYQIDVGGTTGPKLPIGNLTQSFDSQNNAFFSYVYNQSVAVPVVGFSEKVRVQGCSDYGAGPWSETRTIGINIKPLGPFEKMPVVIDPVADSIVPALYTGSYLSVAWDDQDMTSVSGYAIELYDFTLNSTVTTDVLDSWVGSTPVPVHFDRRIILQKDIHITSLKNGRHYGVRVTGFNEFGNGPSSDWAHFTFGSIAPTTPVFTSGPSGNVESPVAASWAWTAIDNVDGYELEIRDVTDPNAAAQAFVMRNSLAYTLTRLNLDNNKQYAGRVRTFTGGTTTGPWSNERTFDTLLTPSIAIAPWLSYLSTGQRIAFDAEANDQFGRALSPRPAFTWSINDEQGGIVDENGIFTSSDAAGSYTIMASITGATGTATVYISKPSTITISAPPKIVGERIYSDGGGYVDLSAITAQDDEGGYVYLNFVSPNGYFGNLYNAYISRGGETDVVVTATTYYPSYATATLIVPVFILDQTPPAIEILSPVEGETLHVHAIPISFNASDRYNVSTLDLNSLIVLVDGVPLTASSVSLYPGYNFAAITAPLADGEHELSISISDSAGNRGLFVSHFTTLADVPQITNTLPVGILSNKRPVVSAELSSSYGIQNADLMLDGSAIPLTIPGQAQADGSFLVQFTPATDLSEGEHHAVLVATDTIGNSNQSAWTFVTDYTGPTISQLTPPDQSLVQGSQDPISAIIFDYPSGVDWSSLIVKLDDAIVSFNYTGTGFTLTPTTPLSFGTHRVDVWVTDKLGQVTTKSWQFFVDARIKNLTPVNGSWQKTAKPNVSAQWDANLQIDPSTVQVILDGNPVTVGTSGFSQIPASDLADGLHNVSVKIGTTGPTVAWKFMVDTQAPVINVADTVIVEADSPSGAIVIYNADIQDNLDPAPLIVFSSKSGSQFPIGSNPVSITATDKAGNQASKGVAIKVVDTTPPIITLAADWWNVTEQKFIYTVTAQTEADLVVTFPFTMATATDIVTAAPQIVYSPESGSLFKLGDNSVTVTATDDAGNASTATFVVRITAAQLQADDVFLMATTLDGAAFTYDANVPWIHNMFPNSTLEVRDENGSQIDSGSFVSYSGISALAIATSPDGYTQTASFYINVDAPSPTIEEHADVEIFYSSSHIPPLQFDPVIAHDSIDPNPTVFSYFQSGYTFFGNIYENLSEMEGGFGHGSTYPITVYSYARNAFGISSNVIQFNITLTYIPPPQPDPGEESYSCKVAASPLLATSEPNDPEYDYLTFSAGVVFFNVQVNHPDQVIEPALDISVWSEMTLKYFLPPDAIYVSHRLADSPSSYYSNEFTSPYYFNYYYSDLYRPINGDFPGGWPFVDTFDATNMELHLDPVSKFFHDPNDEFGYGLLSPGSVEITFKKLKTSTTPNVVAAEIVKAVHRNPSDGISGNHSLIEDDLALGYIVPPPVTPTFTGMTPINGSSVDITVTPSVIAVNELALDNSDLTGLYDYPNGKTAAGRQFATVKVTVTVPERGTDSTFGNSVKIESSYRSIAFWKTLPGDLANDGNLEVVFDNVPAGTHTFTVYAEGIDWLGSNEIIATVDPSEPSQDVLVYGYLPYRLPQVGRRNLTLKKTAPLRVVRTHAESNSLVAGQIGTITIDGICDDPAQFSANGDYIHFTGPQGDITSRDPLTVDSLDKITILKDAQGNFLQTVDDYGAITAIVEVGPGVAAGWIGLQLKADLLGVTNGNLIAGNQLRVLHCNLGVDANHDGQMDGFDALSRNYVQVWSGFGYDNHQKTNERVPIKLDLSTTLFNKRGAVKLVSSSPTVRIFDAAQNGNELKDSDLIWILESRTPPATVYLEMSADELIKMSLIYSFDPTLQTIVGAYSNSAGPGMYGANADGAVANLVLFRASNGLGAPDGVSPHAAIAPGVSVNLSRGNLFLGSVPRTYTTPALGPDLAISYNQMDGLATDLGRGWRSNYDMRVFDGSVYRQIRPGCFKYQRKQDDLLTLVDETGRRFEFKLNAALDTFISDSKCGLLKSEVRIINDGSDKYELCRFDGRVFRFNDGGILTGIKDLSGQKLTTTITGDYATGYHVTEVHDDYSRSVPLDPVGIKYVTTHDNKVYTLGGAGTSWYFKYGDKDRISELHAVGAFSHGPETAFNLSYFDDSGRVKDITLVPAPVAAPAVRTITYTDNGQPVEIVAATVTGMQGGTVSYTITANQDCWTQFTDPAGVSKTQTVDAATRRVQAVTLGRQTVAYTYDDKGFPLTSAVGGGDSYTFTYTSTTNGHLLASSTLAGAGTTTMAYNDEGHVTLLTDPSGGTTKYGYAGHFVSSVTNPLDKVTTMSAFDAFGQATTLTTPMGKTIKRVYTSDGDITSETDPFGLVSTYTYDSKHRVTSSTIPGGAVTNATYDPFGRVLYSTAATGESAVYTYDVLGRTILVKQPGIGDVATVYSSSASGMHVVSNRAWRVLSIQDTDFAGKTVSSTTRSVLVPGQDPVDCTTQYSYTAEGWLDHVTDPMGGITTYTYDAAGRKISMSPPEGGSSTIDYDTAGRVVTTSDLDGHTSTATYDASGRLLTATNPAGGSVTNNYDLAGNLLSTQPSIGGGTQYEYDDDGMNTKTTGPLGKAQETTVDVATKKITQTVDSNPNRSATLSIGKFGSVEKATTPLGDWELYSRVDGSPSGSKPPGEGATNSNFDSLGRMVGQTTPNGNTVKKYDGQFGDLTETTTPRTLHVDVTHVTSTGDVAGVTDDARGTQAPVETVLERDKSGNALRVADARGHVEVRTYDLNNRVTEITGPDSLTTSYEYSPGGKVTSETVAGSSTSYAYNELNLPTTVTDPTGRTVTSTYDAFGKRLSVSAGGLTTTSEYDPVTNLLVRTIQPGGRTIQFHRDDFGRVTEMIDPKGYLTKQEFDDFDRVTKLTYPDGLFETYTYEAANTKNGGRMLTMTDRGGRVTEYFYDAMGRVTGKKLYDGAIDTPFGVVAYGYDANDGRPTSESHNGSSVTRSYDKRGRLTHIGMDGQGVDFTYNDDDTLATKRASGGSVDNYLYDNFGRMIGYQGPGGNASFRIDAKGRVDQVSLPNHVTRTFTFDDAGRALTTAQNIDGMPRTSTQAYDALGRISGITVQDFGGGDWSAQFTYDGAGRLSGETRAGFGAYQKNYTYDPNDNRTTLTATIGGATQNSTYSYNNLNQLTGISGDGEASYQYDVYGNLTHKSAFGLSHDFGYDRLNRRVNSQSYLPLGAGVAAQIRQQSSYRYAGAGWMRTGVTTNGLATSFVYDGQSMVMSKSIAGNVRYAVPGKTALWEHNGVYSSTYTYDGTGNIDGQYTMAGWVAQFGFDGFGNFKVTDYLGEHAPNASGLRYKGQWYDAQTNEYFLRNRYYDAGTGQFGSMDPIGFGGGTNQYGYCGGDPVNNIDPMGTTLEFAGSQTTSYDYYVEALGLAGDQSSEAVDMRNALNYMMKTTSRNFIAPDLVSLRLMTKNVAADLQAGIPSTPAMLIQFSPVGSSSRVLKDASKGFNQGGKYFSSNGHESIGRAMYFTGGVSGDVGSGLDINGQISQAEAEHAALMAKGVSQGDANTIVMSERMPILNLFAKYDELKTGEHLNGFQLNQEMSTTDKVVTVLSATGEIAGYGAMAMSNPKASFLSDKWNPANYEHDPLQLLNSNAVYSGSPLAFKYKGPGIGGKGWHGDQSWRKLVKDVSRGGEHRFSPGSIPTYDEATRLLNEAGATIKRIEPPHFKGGPAGHIDYSHFNYTTPSGVKGHLQFIPGENIFGGGI